MTNNTAIITIFPPPNYAKFELMNERIDLRSGTALWTPGDGDTVKITDKVTVAKPDIVLMEVDFTVFNCSGETRTLNPLISYLGPGGQKREQNIGPVQIKPGDRIPLRTTIQLGIRFGNYDRDNFVHLNLWDKRSIRVKIDFTSNERFRAMLGGRCLGSICYPENVILGFNRSSKVLTNGGTVTLQKGDWRWCERDEFYMDFNAIVKLRADDRYRTRLIFKMLSFGNEFTKSREVEFEPNREIELHETIKMWQSPREGVLKIIDEQSGKEIFKGSIYCSESLLKEIGWKPWLHISQDPHIYLDDKKKEVTIKCYVFNPGGPADNQKWWLYLEIIKYNKVVHRKTWEFKGARSAEHIERSFTFIPSYDKEHTYKLKLSAANKNILTNKQEDLIRTGSFEVPW